MSPAIATIIFIVGILGLFWLDRDQRVQTSEAGWTPVRILGLFWLDWGAKIRTSGALWIPVVWMLIACSRPVAQWLGLPLEDTADQILDGSPIDRVVYTSLLAVGLIVLISRGKPVWSFLWANKLILLFFLYCAVTFFWSDFPAVAFKRWTKAVGDLVMVLIVLTDREPVAAFKRFLKRTAYLLIPVSILFIKYYPSLGVQYGTWDGKASYGGVATNKNTLGVVCLCFGLGSLWRFLAAFQGREGTGRIRRMIAHGVMLAMVGWLFYTIDAVTALSSFVMASTLLLAAHALIRRRWLVHLLIVAMLAVSVSVVFLGINSDVLKSMGRNSTLTDRTEVWGVLLRLVENPWFGTGFESFWLGSRLETMWRLYWWHPNEAHNGYIEVFLNLGWVGVALLAILLATRYRRVFGAWRSNDSTGSLMLAYFFVGLVFNFTEAAFFKMMAPAWIFFLFAIMTGPAISAVEVQPSEEHLFQDPGPLGADQQESTWSEQPV